MKNVVPTMPKCIICGGLVDPRIPAHTLCVDRRKLDLPIQVLDSTPRCHCRPCELARQGVVA